MHHGFSWSLRKAMRAFFGCLLLVTAIGKLLDNRGFAEILGQYQLGFPEPLLLPLALAISLVELAMATAIFAGVHLRLMAQLTALMHATYSIVAAITNLRGIELPNCGCFGVFLGRPMTWATVGEDIVLTLLSLVFLYSVTERERASRTPVRIAADARGAASRGATAHDTSGKLLTQD